MKESSKLEYRFIFSELLKFLKAVFISHHVNPGTDFSLQPLDGFISNLTQICPLYFLNIFFIILEKVLEMKKRIGIQIFSLSC